MVKIYTKTGDRGKTSLLGGQRVLKGCDKISLYGECDELNSWVGVLICHLEEESLKDFLKDVQRDLFCLGSLMASYEKDWNKFKLTRIEKSHVEKLELKIDEWSELLPELKSFILPGGEKAASYSHICRVSARKLERMMSVSDSELEEEALQYINRLSDFFFVLSRLLNFKKKVQETHWP